MRINNYGYRIATAAINAAGRLAEGVGNIVAFHPLNDVDIVNRFQRLTKQFCTRRLGLNRFGINQTGGQAMDPESIVQKLDLQPLPGEGGFYRETYRSSAQIKVANNVGEKDDIRSVSTAIYFMVTPTNFSALHRIRQDEVYHFYAGEPVELLLISEDGKHQLLTLGSDVMKNQLPQVVVPAKTWQGVKLRHGSTGWSLMGTTVAPGFDFADFELGCRNQLIEKYPELQALISLYTRA